MSVNYTYVGKSARVNGTLAAQAKPRFLPVFINVKVVICGKYKNLNKITKI